MYISRHKAGLKYESSFVSGLPTLQSNVFVKEHNNAYGSLLCKAGGLIRV